MDTKTEELGRTVAGALDGFRSATNVMVQAATAVGEGAQRIRDSAARTLEGASISVRDLNAVAASAQDLLTGINEINKQVLGAASSMQAAVERATAAGGGGLSQATEQLATVVRLLSELAVAVKRQSGATRDIVAGVQAAIASGTASNEAIREVVTIAESTESNSIAVSHAAGDVGRLIDALATDVADFLPPVPSSQDEKQRIYERLRASGFEVTLSIAGGEPTQAALLDISRTGIAAKHDCRHTVGTDVTVTLPSGGTVTGRIARIADGVTGIAFPEDNATLVELERTLHLLILSGVGAAA